jgi:hypothetical protein
MRDARGGIKASGLKVLRMARQGIVAMAPRPAEGGEGGTNDGGDQG